MTALQTWSGGAEQRGGRRRRLERHPWLQTAHVAVTPTMRSQTALPWVVDRSAAAQAAVVALMAPDLCRSDLLHLRSITSCVQPPLRIASCSFR